MNQNPDRNLNKIPTQNANRNPSMNRISLIILAGGKSLRMGTNKAHLDWHAMRFIDVLVEKGKQLGFGEIILSGTRENIEGCRNVLDILPGRGPLGGMYSCLKASLFDNALLVPVDCPGISIETIEALMETHIGQRNEITLLQHGNRLEPLIGMYATAFHQKILPVIESGGAPVFRALDRGIISTYHMKEAEPGILNLNTKEAYLAWMEQHENNRRDRLDAGHQ
jgi:molybdopterin-guanine dinucleotide biosynthesis protein A